MDVSVWCDVCSVCVCVCVVCVWCVCVVCVCAVCVCCVCVVCVCGVCGVCVCVCPARGGGESGTLGKPCLQEAAQEEVFLVL